MKNQTAPKKLPSGMRAKTTGKAEKPVLNVPPILACVAVSPRNTTAAVSVIMPPSATSKNSLVAEAVRLDRTMSSFFFMYEA